MGNAGGRLKGLKRLDLLLSVFLPISINQVVLYSGNNSYIHFASCIFFSTLQDLPHHTSSSWLLPTLAGVLVQDLVTLALVELEPSSRFKSQLCRDPPYVTKF